MDLSLSVAVAATVAATATRTKAATTEAAGGQVNLRALHLLKAGLLIGIQHRENLVVRFGPQRGELFSS
jgi:hypothetical protein